MCANSFPSNLQRTKILVVKINKGRERAKAVYPNLSENRINIIAAKKDWVLRCAEALTIDILVSVIKDKGEYKIVDIYKVIHSFTRFVQTETSKKTGVAPTYICRTNFSIRRLKNEARRTQLAQMSISKFPRKGCYIVP